VGSRVEVADAILIFAAIPYLGLGAPPPAATGGHADSGISAAVLGPAVTAGLTLSLASLAPLTRVE
jgi:hypothetical protein